MASAEHEEHIEDIAEEIREEIYRLPFSQAGVNGRHRCPVCAYRLGVRDAIRAREENRLDEFLARVGVEKPGKGVTQP